MNLSTEEKEAISKLRTSIQGAERPVHDDLSLLHWLKAYKLDVSETAKNINKSNDYIKSLNLSEYQPPQVMTDYYAGGRCGFAKDGSAVKVELLGLLDMRGLMRSTRKSDMEKWKMSEYERTAVELAEKTKEEGVPYYGLTTIVNMAGVGTEWLWRPGLETYIHLVNLLQENYPGTVRKLLVINAPSIFPLLWRIAKGFMREDIRDKVEVMGSKYRDGLLTYIDRSQLPAFLGGDMMDEEDEDPFCSSKICPGGKVPETFFLADPDYLKVMTFKEIPCGQRFSVSFEVECPGAILSWAFRTQSNDIGFGVLYKCGEDADEELIFIPQKRVASHVLMEDGSVTCTKPGTYEVCFDNSYSWSKSKKLYYQVEVHFTDDTTLEEVDNFVKGATWKDLKTN